MSFRDLAQSTHPVLDAETHGLLEELFQLVRCGNTARLIRLFDMGLVPNLRDSKGDSLLMLASYHGHQDTTRLLLERGGDPELPNDRGQTPLASAAYKNDLAIAELLLQHGADVDSPASSKTPLMYAAMFNRVPMVTLLLERGANPALISGEGMTAAQLARTMGAQEAAEKLDEPSPDRCVDL